MIVHTQGVEIAAAMIRGKIHNQRILLRRNVKCGLPEADATALRNLSRAASDVTSLPELLGVEGTAARLYFDNFDRMLSPDKPFAAEFGRNGRARRPPPDPVNAVLGFCYALLTKDLVATLVGVGLSLIHI